MSLTEPLIANSDRDQTGEDASPSLPPPPAPMTTTDDGHHEVAAEIPEETPWYKCPLQLVAMLSNYSTSYNVVNISMVIPMLKRTEQGTTAEDAAASASSLLAGMMLGQLVGGWMGDSPLLGRLRALQLVMTLQVVASIGSALLYTNESRERFYVYLAFFRFLLGVGAGGVYPLAAVLSAEQGNDKRQVGDSHNTNAEQSPKQVRRVVLTFSTQGLGFITVPLVTVPLLYITTNLNIVWRVLLGLGAVPGIILMIAQLWIHRKTTHRPLPTEEVATEETVAQTDDNGHRDAESQENPDPAQSEEEEPDGTLLRNMQIMEEQPREDRGRWESIRREPNLIRKLLGTAGTWFLFDVLFYGNTLFQPIVIDAAFGSTNKGGDPISELRNTAINSLILTSIALPGYAVAGVVMGKRLCCISLTPKYVMVQGFAAMSALYFTIGENWSSLRHTPALLVLLYGATFFFANFGPNTTTFILPSLVFSPECRTTLNGISAAAGKLGALTGATLFEPTAARFGDANVMLICAGIALLAVVMTWFFVPTHPSNTMNRHEL